MIEERKKLILGMKGDIFKLQKEFSEKMNVRIKEGDSRNLVTDADTEIEKYLMGKINGKFPEDKIIGEEFGTSYEGGNGFEWYLDPIDGTAYFASGFDQYGTSVGLVLNGKIVFGAIFYAEDQKTYWAENGRGAFCEDERIYCKSKKNKLSEFLVFSGLNYETEKASKEFDTLKGIYSKVKNIRVFGPCVANLIYVAKGKIDAYWEPHEGLSPHDFSAGALIVKEAGGFVSHENPSEFIDIKQGQLFASNGIIHKEFVELIKKYREI